MPKYLSVQEMSEAVRALDEAKGIKAEAARRLGITRSTFMDRLQCAYARGISADSASEDAATLPAPALPATITEAELRDRIDSAYKLEQYARALPEGQYAEQGELFRELRLCGRISTQALESERFARFRGRADSGKYYWGHPKSIARLKEEKLLRS